MLAKSILSSLSKLLLPSSKSSSRPRIPVLPAEIVTEIVRCCIKTFRVSIRRKLMMVGQVRGSRPREVSDGCEYPFCVVGIPDLTNVKLVDHLFYDAVWAGIAYEFNGCLEIDLSYLNEDSSEMINYTNRLLSVPAGRLSWLSRRVTRIETRSPISYQHISGLNVEKLSNLRQIHLDRLPAISDEHEYTRESWRTRSIEAADAGLDPEVIGIFALKAQRIPGLLSSLEALRRRGVAVLLTYGIQEAGYGDITVYEYELDVTDTCNVLVAQRTKIEVYYGEDWESKYGPYWD